MRARLLGAMLVGVLVLAAGVTSAAGRAHHRKATAAAGCSDPHSYKRDASNPLALPAAPGANPLNGANFFIDGPAHGAAAGAIAQLLGLNPANLPSTLSWAQFQNEISGGVLARKLVGNSSLASQVHNLEKIASEPAANRFSLFSQGGSPAGIYNQAIKIFCGNMQADPGTVPILTTYFLHHSTASSCPTPSALRAAQGVFRRRVDAVARATANRPAVYLVELDGIGSSRCIQKAGSLKIWEADLRYETSKLGSLPHTVVYMEAGYSDGNPVGYTAKALNAGGVRHIQGFWTNDTHLNWTINEIKWGEKISRKTHGAHFVINTAQNGNGPLRNPHPSTQGNENTCNPPGRALGPPPTTNTGYPGVDAFLWSSPPGNSGGSCNGGPPAGSFFTARAIQLAAAANARLGPGFPSKPY